jgi:septal ring factor EnvC (AmiA/AmiB activator)
MSLPKIQSSLEKIEAQISETQIELKRVEEIVTGSRGESNTKMEVLIGDTNSKFVTLKNELSATRNDLNSLRSNIEMKLESLEKRLIDLEVSFKKLEESLRA